MYHNGPGLIGMIYISNLFEYARIKDCFAGANRSIKFRNQKSNLINCEVFLSDTSSQLSWRMENPLMYYLAKDRHHDSVPGLTEPV